MGKGETTRWLHPQRRSRQASRPRLRLCHIESAEHSTKKSNGKDESTKPEALRCRFYDLRHTVVTRLLEAGIPYPVVASMMGWSAATAIRMAERYGHIGNRALRDAADV